MLLCIGVTGGGKDSGYSKVRAFAIANRSFDFRERARATIKSLLASVWVPSYSGLAGLNLWLRVKE